MYSVTIFTRPIKHNIVFDSEELRKAYILKEFKFTKEARVFRYSCDLKDMEGAVAALAAEQLLFAHAQGYSPIKNDRYTWKIGQDNEPKMRA